MMRNFVYAFALVMLIGCSEHITNKSLLTIGGLDTDTFDYSNESIYAIALETTQESVVSEFTKIVVSDSAIVILDNEQMKISIFDHTGRFISVIDARGRSAKEYTSIGDIDIFEENIYILDYGQRKILVADYDGNITRVVKYHNYYGMRFYVDANGFTFFMHHDNNELNSGQIVSLNMSEELINTYLPLNENQRFPIVPSIFFAKNNTANYFIPVFSDKLYTIKDDKSEIVYDFNIGKMIKDNSVDRSDRKSNKFNYFFGLSITDDMTFICSNEEYGELYDVICNINSGKSRLSNDVIITGAYKNYFITIDSHLSKYPNIGELNYPVGEEGNPALVFIPTSAIIY